MRSSWHDARLWGIAAAILTIGTLLFAVAASLTLDAFVRRLSQGGSMTTMLPGFTYATATIMKASIVAGIVAAAASALAWMRGTIAAPASFPARGMTAIALPPLAPIVGALAVIVAQAVETPASLAELSRVSRVGVLVELAVLAAAAVCAAAAVAARERPRLLALAGIVVNALLIVLFWYNRFYALGFDQDTWAPR